MQAASDMFFYWTIESTTSQTLMTSTEEECLDSSFAVSQRAGHVGVQLTTWVTQASHLLISSLVFD